VSFADSWRPSRNGFAVGTNSFVILTPLSASMIALARLEFSSPQPLVEGDIVNFVDLLQPEQTNVPRSRGLGARVNAIRKLKQELTGRFQISQQRQLRPPSLQPIIEQGVTLNT